MGEVHIKWERKKMSLSDTTPQSKKYSWFVLLMMVLLYLVNVADRYLASGLLEEIKKNFANFQKNVLKKSQMHS